MFKINKVNLSNMLVHPIIEGGKGISVSTGITAGNFAKNGAVGTFSAVNSDYVDENGAIVLQLYEKHLTRREKFEKLVQYAISGGISQAKIAHDISEGKGRIHMNILWESVASKKIIEEILSKVKGLVHGVTCGAGLPYELAEIASKYKVYYYPIVSSARAFSVLWKRAYHKFSDFLGGVVYEDPWTAGGHLGFSSKEDINIPEDPYERILLIRKEMDKYKLEHVPIIIAGGVWNLKEWQNYIDNKEIGEVAFQFGTRPLLTKESPIPDDWKKLLLNLSKEDIVINKFSPTGFYSNAINNDFLKELQERSDRQLDYSHEETAEFSSKFEYRSGRFIFLRSADIEKANNYYSKGFNKTIKTPSNSVVFVTKEKAQEILKDQSDCMGCLSACQFSNWAYNEKYTTGLTPDPRSYCIQKTLQDIGHGGNINTNLLFSGKSGYRFKTDPLYSNGNIPTIKELIDTILLGE